MKIILTFLLATGRDWSGPKGSAAETGLSSQVILFLEVHVWQT